MSLDWSNGLQGLPAAHAAKVLDKAVHKSCALDDQFAAVEPTASRWDYVLTRRADPSTGVGVEVHGADVNEVNTMIRKKRWAESTIAREEPGLTVDRWHWVTTSGVYLPKTTPQYRNLVAAGIQYPTKVISRL